MSILLDASPTTGGRTADPFTASEIDAHPDADRIWATIVSIRSAISEERKAQERRFMLHASEKVTLATNRALFSLIPEGDHQGLFDVLEKSVSECV